MERVCSREGKEHDIAEEDCKKLLTEWVKNEEKNHLPNRSLQKIRTKAKKEGQIAERHPQVVHPIAVFLSFNTIAKQKSSKFIKGG